MKIEPGTLCIVRQNCPDPDLRGLIVVVVRPIPAGERFAPVENPWIRFVTEEFNWGCKGAGGDLLGTVLGSKKFHFDPFPLEPEHLTPISGPGLDLSEKTDLDFEADTDAAGFKARRVARLAGDDSWD